MRAIHGIAMLVGALALPGCPEAGKAIGSAVEKGGPEIEQAAKEAASALKHGVEDTASRGKGAAEGAKGTAEAAAALTDAAVTEVQRFASKDEVVAFLARRGVKEPRQVVDAFSGPMTLVRTARAASLQRLCGGDSREVGQWWMGAGLGGAGELFALPKGNLADLLVVADVPAGSEFLQGTVAPKPEWERRGGGTQYFALDTKGFAVKERWLKEGGARLQKQLAEEGRALVAYQAGAVAGGVTLLFYVTAPSRHD